MESLDVVAVGTFVALTLTFVVVRKRPLVFLLICAAWLGAAGLGAWHVAASDRVPEASLLVAGLLLYACGLFIVRLMLQRSVSLHLLFRCLSDQKQSTMHDELAERLQDAEKYRLARLEGETYQLTRPGRLVAAVMGVLYRVGGNPL